MRLDKCSTNRLQMRRNFPLCVLFWLVSCGHTPYKNFGGFGAYIQKFEEESVKYNKKQEVIDLTVSFSSNLKSGVAGNCFIGVNTTPKISVSSEIWEMLTEERREMLIFHELGHCILGYEHDESKSSIMYKELPMSYFGHRDEMLTYFFTKE